MEELIIAVFKESAMTGAFIYLLHHFLGKQSTQMEFQSRTLESVGDTLSNFVRTLDKVSMTLLEVCDKMEDISKTIVTMDTRIQKLEERGYTQQRGGE